MEGAIMSKFEAGSARRKKEEFEAGSAPWEKKEEFEAGSAPWEKVESSTPSQDVLKQVVGAPVALSDFLSNVVKGGVSKSGSIMGALEGKTQPSYAKIAREYNIPEGPKPLSVFAPDRGDVTKPWLKDIPKQAYEDVTLRDIGAGAAETVLDPVNILGLGLSKAAIKGVRPAASLVEKFMPTAKKGGAASKAANFADLVANVAIHGGDLAINPVEKGLRGVGSSMYLHGMRQPLEALDKDQRKWFLEHGLTSSEKMQMKAAEIQARTMKRIAAADEASLNKSRFGDMDLVYDKLEKKAASLRASGKPEHIRMAADIDERIAGDKAAMVERFPYTPIKPTTSIGILGGTKLIPAGPAVSYRSGQTPSQIRFNKTRAAEELRDAEMNKLKPQTFDTQLKSAEAEGYRLGEMKLLEATLGKKGAEAQKRDYQKLGALLDVMYPTSKLEDREARKVFLGMVTAGAAMADPKVAAGMIATKKIGKFAAPIGHQVYRVGATPISQVIDSMVRQAMYGNNPNQQEEK
jgi:hypothetical protein